MFKLDNDFLTSLGLGGLPVDEKNKLLQMIYERLEMNVGMRLAEKMTDQQLDEFEAFIDQNDEAGALKWLETNFPNYKDVVAEELEKLKVEVTAAAPQILASHNGSNQPQPAIMTEPQMPGVPQPAMQQPAYPAQPQPAQPAFTPPTPPQPLFNQQQTPVNPMPQPAPQPYAPSPPAPQAPVFDPTYSSFQPPAPTPPAEPQMQQPAPQPSTGFMPQQPSFTPAPPQPAPGFQPPAPSQPQPFGPPPVQPFDSAQNSQFTPPPVPPTNDFTQGQQ